MKTLDAGHLFGSVLRRQELANLILTETLYQPEQRIPRHVHAEAGFCFVLTGSLERRSVRRSETCRTSTLSFHPPGEPHDERIHQRGARLFSIQFGDAWQDRLETASVALSTTLNIRETRLSSLVRRLYRESARPDELTPLMVEGLTLEIATEAVRWTRRETKGTPKWLIEARDLLHEHFREHLTLDELARRVEVHPVHLARAFRQRFGCTVGDYVRRLRIEYCRDRLESSEQPIADVALEAGFASQSHLCTTFRRVLGMTPGELRDGSRSANPMKSVQKLKDLEPAGE